MKNKEMKIKILVCRCNRCNKEYLSKSVESKICSNCSKEFIQENKIQEGINFINNLLYYTSKEGEKIPRNDYSNIVSIYFQEG